MDTATPGAPTAPLGVVTEQAGAVPGETLVVPERVIVAPTVGTFRPAEPVAEIDLETTPTDVIAAGQAVGFVDGPGSSIPVRSPFSGVLIGMLAHAGERVREGQPVAWLRQI